ncbi:MAG: SDR family NAD(P)-dependent oxidoreductase [Parachlamydiales bacterium]|jgi:3-hydroxy acid dehydrogenase/malonic semialdehyde reductase
MSQNIVVITGASSGIGAASAKRFASAGWRVILLARRKDRLQELCKEIGESTVSFYELDVTSLPAVEETFAKIYETEGNIDLLVNNAGGAFGLSPAQKADIEDWEKCIDVNINGLIYCTHTVLPFMVAKNKGHIINMGSVAGTYPYPGANVYGGVKAFVQQFSLNLRSDLLGTAVRVSCIEPGLVGGTEFSLVRFRGDTSKVKQVYDNTEPLLPADVAETIFFCAALPPHVNINTIELMPVSQAFSPLTVIKSHA